MKIHFSDHCLTKIDILKKHEINIEKKFVEEVVLNPEGTEKGYKGRMIAQKTLDESHVLRVVYEKKKDDILIITIYPGRSQRYDKSKIQ